MAVNRNHGPKSKNHDVGERDRRISVFIAAEGRNETEKNYFLAMKKFYSDKLSIKLVTDNVTDPVKMMDGLIKQFKNSDKKPEVKWAFCLVDSDVNKNKNVQIAEADRMAFETNQEVYGHSGTDDDLDHIQLILSVPCFEVWYICHFSAEAPHYTKSKDAKDKLRQYIPGYTETMDVFDFLISKKDVAVKNALKLEKNCIDSGYKRHTVDFMPSTEVYKILNLLDS